MTIYSATLFFNEFKLLDLKIAEELDVVDEIHIVESNQTYQANPKPLYLKDNPKYNHPKIKIHFLEDKLLPKTKNGTTPNMANQRIQRNSIWDFIRPKKDDVLIVTDLDEINVKEDIPLIVEKTKEHECIRLQMYMCYYKINLQRSNKRGWLGPFATTGKYVLENKLQLQDIRGNRQRLGKPILTNGRHFSFLMTPEEIAYKIQNFSHSEFAKEEFLDLDKIQKRIDDLADPFDRTTSDGSPRSLIRVDIDDTYPKTILNNLKDWEEFIA